MEMLPGGDPGSYIGPALSRLCRGSAGFPGALYPIGQVTPHLRQGQ